MHEAQEKARAFLKNLQGKPQDRPTRIQHSIDLATLLLQATLEETTPEEEKQKQKIARMMEDPKGKAFVTAMIDQCFRSENDYRTAGQLDFLLTQFGVPRFFNENEKIQLIVFQLLWRFFPHFFAKQSKKLVKKEFAHVLLPNEEEKRTAYFEKCQKNRTTLNINHLGEAILGEEEALKRLTTYLEDLTSPDISYISIKISSIYSQIHLIGWEETLTVLSERLRLLFRTAMQHKILFPSGQEGFKFVNLDMEESKDLELTATLFKKVLDEPEFYSLSAGIVLQSYLPESYEMQKNLTAWAIERCHKGGVPIKIRLVKGANLAMEKVEASLKGWLQTPFLHKEQTDANFRRMLEFGMLPSHAASAHIGVASHNLLDIAFAMVLRAEFQIEPYISFEMLQGMAEPMRRVVQALSGQMLLYSPEAKEEDFHAAVGYLIRRLDENSGSFNFLRHFFALDPHSEAWKNEISFFKKGCSLVDRLPREKKRIQNRMNTFIKEDQQTSFSNEPDTDFSLSQNREWAHSIYQEWKEKKHLPIPLVIEGREIFGPTYQTGIDPSNPHTPLYSFTIANLSHLDQAVHCAKMHEDAWSKTSIEERSQLLGKTAHLFRLHRNILTGAMIADAGKVILEADIEVSEAIDFIEYYRKNWEKMTTYSDIQWIPRGTILVAPPWNFPCSIPTGGIAAALMAGNCVLFKPAPEAVLVGWHVVQQFWEAGVPKEVLQWINCPDDPEGSVLVKDARINGIVLTGATETARKFMQMRPSLYLAAETGGKNVMIVTAMSDRDLAIRDLMQSAFGHAGQKCSACSLVILEAEVYDDPHFLHQLRDAAKSLCVGSAWKPNTKIPPLIRPPDGALLRALTELEKEETWLLEPRQDPDNPHLWSPGIKLGVEENSFTYRTELFGPLLGVMRAKNLSHALQLANGTPYGLTSGLHSLDGREHALWKEKIEAGNLYINRTMTGAIVRRQPFGGCKASSFGPGAKAGGPNYVLQLASLKQKGLPKEKAPLPPSALPLFAFLSSYTMTEEESNILKHSIESYAYWAQVLKEPVDPSCLLGQDNYFFHVPRKKMVLRKTPDVSMLDLLRISFACLICGTPLEISCLLLKSAFTNIPGLTWRVENQSQFFERIKQGNIPFLRLLTPPSQELLRAASEGETFLISEEVLANGRFELLHYLREVSLSHDYHRYGYLGLRDQIDNGR